MADLLPLEQNFNDIFTKNTPSLPPKGKQVLSDFAPWLALIGGVLSLLGAWSLWHWAHVVNAYVDYANSIGSLYGVNTAPVERMSAMVWIALLFLAAEGVIYLLAFPKLRKREKSGWNLLYIGALLNIAYGIAVLFSAYGGIGNFLFSLIFSAIGLYLLFQIRSVYTKVLESGQTKTQATVADAPSGVSEISAEDGAEHDKK